MRLSIDASNIRAGGGLTHLVELLGAATPQEHGFSSVEVWAGSNTLAVLPERPWLHRMHHWLLDGPLPGRILWQLHHLPKAARGSALLFAPGGSYAGRLRPYVTMSRNLLPFDLEARRRLGLTARRLRFHVLQQAQATTYRRARGVIHLTNAARIAVEGSLGQATSHSTVIPHGVSEKFLCAPRSARPLAHFSEEEPFRLLYVSTVDVYKHQVEVAEAVSLLRSKGLPVSLDIIGAGVKDPLRRLQKALADLDPAGSYLRYCGQIPYSELAGRYKEADAFVFASSCETFGQILVEAMASGLPIACSNRSSMPETLGHAGLYFDPEKPTDIASGVEKLMRDAELRERLAWTAYERAQSFTWERCAEDTFRYLAACA